MRIFKNLCHFFDSVPSFIFFIRFFFLCRPIFYDNDWKKMEIKISNLTYEKIYQTVAKYNGKIICETIVK